MEEYKGNVNTNTVEAKVYDVLSRLLSKGEELMFDPQTDLFLPNGLKKLQWPSGTHIEIKFRLVGYSLDIVREISKAVYPNKLIVVYFDAGYNVSLVSKALNRQFEQLEFVSYDELVKHLSTQKEARLTNTINDQDRLIYKAKTTLKNEKITLFLGAGVSASAGAPTWNSLLEHLYIKKGISRIDSDVNSITKGRFVIDEYKKQSKDLDQTSFYEDLKEVLYQSTKESKLISAISNLVQKCSVESIITYNYDNLIEEEINRGEKQCESIYDKKRTNKLPVYHVHGYISKSGEHSDIILGEQEYHNIYAESYNWGSVEQLHAMCRTTCFFIGLSMSDPNLRRLLDISNKDSDIESAHYAFLRRIDYNVPFTETIMRGFGINCIWYDLHEDLPIILNNFVEEEHKRTGLTTSYSDNPSRKSRPSVKPLAI